MKIRSKSRVFEAVKFTGSNLDEIKIFIGDSLISEKPLLVDSDCCVANVSSGDWIILKDSCFYVRNSRYFAFNYDIVEEWI